MSTLLTNYVRKIVCESMIKTLHLQKFHVNKTVATSTRHPLESDSAIDTFYPNMTFRITRKLRWSTIFDQTVTLLLRNVCLSDKSKCSEAVCSRVTFSESSTIYDAKVFPRLWKTTGIDCSDVKENVAEYIVYWKFEVFYEV